MYHSWGFILKLIMKLSLDLFLLTLSPRSHTQCGAHFSSCPPCSAQCPYSLGLVITWLQVLSPSTHAGVPVLACSEDEVLSTID